MNRRAAWQRKTTTMARISQLSSYLRQILRLKLNVPVIRGLRTRAFRLNSFPQAQRDSRLGDLSPPRPLNPGLPLSSKIIAVRCSGKGSGCSPAQSKALGTKPPPETPCYRATHVQLENNCHSVNIFFEDFFARPFAKTVPPCASPQVPLARAAKHPKHHATLIACAEKSGS
jgi:hypothetical protein